jgi:H+/Cl- antiporter ClcA
MQESESALSAFARRVDLLGMVWRRRFAAASGAILVGLAALSFAYSADRVQQFFFMLTGYASWLGWITPPLGFVLLVWATRLGAGQARGSGIPQVILAARSPERAIVDGLVS